MGLPGSAVTPGPSSGSAPGPALPEEAVPPAATVLQQVGGAEKTSINLAGLLAHGGHGIIVRGGQSGAASTQELVIEDCRRPFRPLAISQPIHVQSISWPNDDLLPIDVLAANGLMVTLDQAVSGPVDSGRFIVTLEALTSQNLIKQANEVALPTSYVLDSPIVVSGQQLTWQLGQPALGYVQTLIAFTQAFGQSVRVRVRLPGQAYFATYGTELIYLDGRAFGQAGTRTDGTTEKVDLRFPSGDGSAASDLESWFYLAPALTATALTPTSGNAFTTVADSGGNFIGVVPAGSTGATPVTEADLTATLSYAAVVSSTLSVTVSSLSTRLLANIVSAPATVAIAPAQSSVTIPLTFSGNLPAGTSDTITIGATVVSASAQIANAAPTTTTVTLSGPGGTTPAPAAAAGSTPPGPTGAAPVPGPAAPPTAPIPPPGPSQPESPAQAEPPAQPQPPQAPEASDPPAPPPAKS